MDECAESREVIKVSGGISKCMKGDDHGYAYSFAEGNNASTY